MDLPAAFFVPAGIEERPITLENGERHTLWFKHLPSSAFELYALWRSSQDEQTVALSTARLIAMGLCDPTGVPFLTPERADTLKRPVVLQLMDAIFDVNGYGRKKKLPPGTAIPPKLEVVEGGADEGAEPQEGPPPNGLGPEAKSGSGTS